MFNKEFKEEYLRNSKYKTVASSFFKKSKNLESSLNKDVCTFDVHEFRKVLSDVNIKSSNSVRSFRNFIHEYIEWCSGFGINVNYEIAKVDVDTSGSILTSMVSSPAHLKHVLDDIFDRPDEITSDLINRCYLWCAFYGVDTPCVESIFSMKKEDFLKDDFAVLVNGELYEIGLEAWKEFSLLVSEDAFNYKHSNYTSKRKRVDSDFIFRGTGVSKKEHVAYESIKSSTIKKVAKSQYKISYVSIFKSGLFYRTYEMERAGVEPDFTDYCIRRFYEVGGDYFDLSKNANKKNRMIHKRSVLKKEYNEWKDALF